MRTKQSLMLAIILSGSMGLVAAGCSQTSSSTEHYALYGDNSDCYSSYGGSQVGTGAGSNGSSSTDDNSGLSGCTPSEG